MGKCGDSAERNTGLKNMLFFKGTCFSLKLVRNFSFKIDDKPLDLDPNWAKIQNPNLNSMYLDPQHWW